MSFGDAQIAAVARCHGAIVCTRNKKDFVDCGVQVWNPWAEGLEECS
jgi:predicted nucleic acid-binding protein